MAGSGNICDDIRCHPIYPNGANGHIKQPDSDRFILGFKPQFCAAFYHVYEKETENGTRPASCLDSSNCLISKTNPSVLRDLDFAVAVLKYEVKDVTKYEARYSSCAKKKKHPINFFDDDMQKGRLSELLPTPPTLPTSETLKEKKEKITLYLQYPPCPTCCGVLKDVHVRMDELRIKFDVKFARLTDDAEQEKGIEMLIRQGIVVASMNEVDWTNLMQMVDHDPKEQRERHISRDVLEPIYQRFYEELEIA